MQEDQLKDLEEGIFIFRRAHSLCELKKPVDEEEYLKNHKLEDESDYLRHKLATIDKEGLSSNLMKRKSTKLAEWEYASKIVVYEARSLNLFHHKTAFRRNVLSLVESRIFEISITTLILLNSVTLAIYDYNDREDACMQN